ncbi:jasmonoyl--L-amino acid synthetase JAR6-like [Impatiens glandulifera]|uniref:jasmonoyl--L-amino acid synthetase JAR6-like n=1 Tax=Impatiens glandulifera TaxID=253017 RepID=UPI001FB0C134|nr:jasmonoyl--L-amino acid synthetase JAR6-like [Impatiens glandulifera]
MMKKIDERFDSEQFIQEFDLLTKDAEKVQRDTLKKILNDNFDSEYLQKWKLENADPEIYKAKVPLVTHHDLEPYIQRIVDGEITPILTKKPITTISLSSGTTQGRPKFVPFNDELVDTTMQIYKTSFSFRNRLFPIRNGKALQFIYSSKQFKTKGGLAAGTATTNVYRSPQFKKTMNSMQIPCSSPDEVIFGPDFHQSLYCHLLCALIHRNEIQVISSTFAHSIVHAFRTFEQVWEELCTNIREGVLSDRINGPSIRIAMEKLLKPNPELADLIYKNCSSLIDWYRLIPTLFPNAMYVYGIMTGSMEPYLKKLRHYAGELPLLSSDYGSSEGWIGANVKPQSPPECATYAVLPHIGYFEFIPLNDGFELEAKPIGLTEVKIGEEYEIVVTNFAGLYRYRLGDVVKVTGFYNSTPELQFVCRKNLMLNINIDKNTERDLQLAVEISGKLLAGEVVDFTSLVDVSNEPGHYVVFWELSGNLEDERILGECCDCLDRSFVDAGYVSSRKVRAIGPLELRLVKIGTFQKILDHFLGMGAAFSQYKTPRCVGKSNVEVIRILSSNVVKSYFSSAFG